MRDGRARTHVGAGRLSAVGAPGNGVVHVGQVQGLGEDDDGSVGRGDPGIAQAAEVKGGDGHVEVGDGCAADGTVGNGGENVGKAEIARGGGVGGVSEDHSIRPIGGWRRGDGRAIAFAGIPADGGHGPVEQLDAVGEDGTIAAIGLES